MRIPISWQTTIIIKAADRWSQHHLSLLGLSILINTATFRAICIDTSSLRKILHSTVDIFFKDGIGFDLFELGLEVFETGSVRAAVGATTSIGHSEAFVLDFFTFYTPVCGALVDVC
ncbi:hypothetical protein ACMFMG_012186 [Clarireedia jacksonii]